MQAIIMGQEKVKQQLAASASANDGPAFEFFHKTLNQLISIVESEVGSVTNLYSVVVRINILLLIFLIRTVYFEFKGTLLVIDARPNVLPVKVSNVVLQADSCDSLGVYMQHAHSLYGLMLY